MSQEKLKKVIGITVAAIVLLAIFSPKYSTPAATQAAPTVVQPFSRMVEDGEALTYVEKLRAAVAILGVYHTRCEELPPRVADQLLELLKEHRDWMKPYILDVEARLKQVGTSKFCAAMRKTARSIEL